MAPQAGGALTPFLLRWASCTDDLLFLSRLVVTDPEDPRFDLEKLVAKWELES